MFFLPNYEFLAEWVLYSRVSYSPENTVTVHMSQSSLTQCEQSVTVYARMLTKEVTQLSRSESSQQNIISV